MLSNWASLCKIAFLKVYVVSSVFPLESIMVLIKKTDFSGGEKDMGLRGCRKRRQVVASGKEKTEVIF